MKNGYFPISNMHWKLSVLFCRLAYVDGSWKCQKWRLSEALSSSHQGMENNCFGKKLVNFRLFLSWQRAARALDLFTLDIQVQWKITKSFLFYSGISSAHHQWDSFFMICWRNLQKIWNASKKMGNKNDSISLSNLNLSFKVEKRVL